MFLDREGLFLTGKLPACWVYVRTNEAHYRGVRASKRVADVSRSRNRQVPQALERTGTLVTCHRSTGPIEGCGEGRETRCINVDGAHSARTKFAFQSKRVISTGAL